MTLALSNSTPFSTPIISVIAEYIKVNLKMGSKRKRGVRRDR